MDETAPPLLPRYRRPLTFGGVLDETFRLYRDAWPRLMSVTALASLPGAIAIALLTGQTYAFTLNAAALAEEDPELLARTFAGVSLWTLVGSVVSGLGALVAQGGVTWMTGRLVRGERPPAVTALLVALRKVLVMLGAGIVYALGILGLTLLAVPLLVVGLGGILGGLVALIAISVWVNRPPERRSKGLKWLIILATPFGLPTYYGVRWSLSIPAIFLERAGPVQSLRRSGDLVEGRWFPLFGIWLVLGIVVGLLQAIPVGIISLVGGIVAANSLQPEVAGLYISVAQNAATIVGSVLFGALSFIAATILFEDARNRREGADLAERLDLLQSGPGEPAVPATT